MNATISLVSPDGFPIQVTISPGDVTEDITEAIERANSLGKYYKLHGWASPEASATGPSAEELGSVPRFGGYECSPTGDAEGFPTYIIADGQQAHRREKQGDRWYSVKRGDGDYITILRIPKGETISSS